MSFRMFKVVLVVGKRCSAPSAACIHTCRQTDGQTDSKKKLGKGKKKIHNLKLQLH
jgi:hypothetical protein